MKAMQGFRGVSAALLKRFLYTGLNTLEQIEQYLDTACLHPTDRHWVNFLHTLHKKEEPPKIMTLFPMSANPLQHVLRAHLQVMLWKAADHQIWMDTISIPAVAWGAPAPPELLNVIKCQK